MKKVIHMFVDKPDWISLMELVKDSGFSMYCKEYGRGGPIEMVPIEYERACEKETDIYLVDDYSDLTDDIHENNEEKITDSIVLDPPNLDRPGWEDGLIVYEGAPRSRLSVLFNTIKKFIVSNWILSDNKLVYVGAHTYKRWLNYEQHLPLFIKFRKVVLDNADGALETYIERIVRCGYIVEVTDFCAYSTLYAIYKPGASLVTTELDDEADKVFFRSMYEDLKIQHTVCLERRIGGDSQCAFLEVKKIKKGVYKYEIIFDERLFINSCESICELYELTKSYCGGCNG